MLKWSEVKEWVKTSPPQAKKKQKKNMVHHNLIFLWGFCPRSQFSEAPLHLILPHSRPPSGVGEITVGGEGSRANPPPPRPPCTPPIPPPRPRPAPRRRRAGPGPGGGAS